MELTMYYREYRQTNEEAHSKLLFLSLFFVFVSAICLGSLRLYGLYIDHRISETVASIERCQEKNQKLSQVHAELLAPARIYSYAREKLGMVNGENPQIVQIDMNVVAVASAKTNVVREEGLIERLNPFVKSAHAKN